MSNDSNSEEMLNYTVQATTSADSKFQTDFKNLSFIAEGGFGSVFRGRHILDGVDYAIKKIKIYWSDRQDLKKIVNEVRTLAGLEHSNIVPYKQAWFEEGNDDDSSKNGSEYSLYSDENAMNSSFDFNDNDQQMYDESREGLFASLYIQMAHRPFVLRQWLNDRNDTHENFDIFYNDFIRKYKEETKESNFHRYVDGYGSINMETEILGWHADFQDSLIIQEEAAKTKMYAAPEQLKGKCQVKSDLYSLGIILIELFIVFKTDSERIEVLGKARLGEIPPQFPSKYLHLLQKLIQHDPERRPSVSEVQQIVKRYKRFSVKSLAHRNWNNE